MRWALASGLVVLALGGGATLAWPRALDVGFAGCERITPGPVCWMDRETLHLFVPARRLEALDVTLHGEPIPVRTASTAGGVRLALDAPPPGGLVLTARARWVRYRWSIRLRRAPKSNRLDAAAARAARGDLEPLQELAESEPSWVSSEARLALAKHARAQGDSEAATVHQAAAAELAELAVEPALVAKARFARAYTLAFDLSALDRAAKELDELTKLREPVPTVSAYLPYYRGLVYAEAGDITHALTRLRQSSRRARELGMDTLFHLLEQERAAIETQLGYHDAALGRLRDVLRWARANGDPCAEAHAATNTGWTLLMKARSTDVPEARVRAPLEAALRLYAGPCPRLSSLANVRLNLAVASLRSGDLEQTRRWLDQAEPRLAARHRSWHIETSARLALAEGRLGEALALAERLIAEARAASDAEARFRGQVVRAEVLTRMGRRREALEAHRRAERVLDQLSLRVPIVGDRHAFLAERDANVLGFVERLIQADQPGEALRVLRRARGRSLGWARVSQGLARLSPERRAAWDRRLGQSRLLRAELDREAELDWTLAASELDAARQARRAREERLEELLESAMDLLPTASAQPSRRPGVLELAFVHLARGRFIVGRLDDDPFAVRWHPEDSEPPEAVARRLRRARRVHLHPYGDLRRRDLHMLEWDRSAMAARLPTAYPLGLPEASTPRDPRTAVLVADPEAALQRSDEEATLVAASLARAGLRIERLNGARDVKAEVAAADWLHFGGHGSWRADDPMAGGLALSGDARLSIGDILALPRAPRVVVLTSCDAGRGAARGGETLGIAHAFIVAGAHAVVAPNRPVTDDQAVRFARAFYRASGSVAERYRETIAALGAEGAPFRLFVP